MDMELGQALVIGFGIGHRLGAVKDDILWQYGYGLWIMDSEPFKTRLIITRHVSGGQSVIPFLVKTGISVLGAFPPRPNQEEEASKRI